MWSSFRALANFHVPLLTNAFEDVPPARRARPTAFPVPIPRSALIGRRHDLATLSQLLRSDDVRLLTLSGAGGCGKTRLAIEACPGRDGRLSGRRVVRGPRGSQGPRRCRLHAGGRSRFRGHRRPADGRRARRPCTTDPPPADPARSRQSGAPARRGGPHRGAPGFDAASACARHQPDRSPAVRRARLPRLALGASRPCSPQHARRLARCTGDRALPRPCEGCGPRLLSYGSECVCHRGNLLSPRWASPRHRTGRRARHHPSPACHAGPVA